MRKVPYKFESAPRAWLYKTSGTSAVADRALYRRHINWTDRFAQASESSRVLSDLDLARSILFRSIAVEGAMMEESDSAAYVKRQATGTAKARSGLAGDH